MKEELTDKYTGEESNEEDKEVVQEDDQKEVYAAIPAFVTSKVEDFVETTEESYGSTCDHVSFYSFSSLQLFAFIKSH